MGVCVRATSSIIAFRFVSLEDNATQTKYVRRKIDFNVFDGIGEAPKIHATSLENSADLNAPIDYPDSISIGSRNTLIVPQRPILNRRTSTLSKSGSVGTMSRVSRLSSFPTAPKSFPKAPIARVIRCSVVPESPDSDNEDCKSENSSRNVS